MECRVIKYLLILAFMVVESIQEPSLDCQRDTRLFFGSDRYYTSGIRYKCTFININSVDDFKNVFVGQTFSAQNVVAISFNQSNLSEFPERMFSSYTSLRTLDGSSLNLDTLHSSSLNNLPTLDFINLSFNSLESLTIKAFANRKLKSLDLSNNMITTIDDSAFSGSEIEKLNLAFNKIANLGFINGMKFFNFLQMNNNEVETFDVVELKHSNWNGQRDNFLGPIFPSISLGNNKLKSFICKSTLRYQLIEIKDNEDLKFIDVGACPVNNLDVSGCGNLKSIKLSDNIEGFTAKNVKFEEIDLSNTKSLESIKLINNSLSTKVLNDISMLENLTSLDLSYNTIGPLNISTFAKLKKLSTLVLKATNISNIQFGTFSHQIGVKMLDISDNNLGNFDMQMIFSMTSLTYLDLSGNDLIELSNIEAAHNTFALLEKIDLTNNKWSCSYLLRLIKIMRAYRVTLAHSYVEEHKSNINGIYCRHIDGDDTIIEPLSADSSNITDVRDKMNEIVSQLTKETQYRSDMEARLSTLEKKVNNQGTMLTTNEALRSNKGSEVQNIQVQNGTLFEMTLVVVLCCLTVFVLLQLVVFVKRNFLSQPRSMRVGLSEHTLTMSNDDY